MMLPDSVFLKRVVPSQLPARAATKWIRDTQSYRTEVGFYAHFVETLRKQGVLLPISYKVVSTGLKDLTDMLSQYSVSTPEIITADADKIESVVKKCHFLCIVEDLNPARYRQDMLLGREEMDRTLAAMARFHGVTWQNPELLSAAKEHLFENGAYWSPDKRDAKEVASLPKVWNEWLEQFSAVLGEEICESVGVQRLGSRLSASAEAVSDRLHQSFDSPHQCLIHGDLKTANVLLATDWDAAALQQGDGGVMLIDFQWTVRGPDPGPAFALFGAARRCIRRAFCFVFDGHAAEGYGFGLVGVFPDCVWISIERQVSCVGGKRQWDIGKVRA